MNRLTVSIRQPKHEIKLYATVKRSASLDSVYVYTCLVSEGEGEVFAIGGDPYVLSSPRRHGVVGEVCMNETSIKREQRDKSDDKDTGVRHCRPATGRRCVLLFTISNLWGLQIYDSHERESLFLYMIRKLSRRSTAMPLLDPTFHLYMPNGFILERWHKNLGFDLVVACTKRFMGVSR